MSRVICDEKRSSGCLACVAACLDRGCRMCLRVCPYDVPKFDVEGKIVKCDGCSVRVALGMEPACVRACNTGALKYEKSKIDIVF